MAHIDEQLRGELASLEEHIARTTDRFLASRWVAELLPAVRRVGRHLPAAELEAALSALRQARDRFHVNGHLSVEIDALVDRFGVTTQDPEGDAGEYDEALLLPSGDPGDTAEGTAQGLFEEEDEEEEGDTGELATPAGDVEALFAAAEGDEEGLSEEPAAAAADAVQGPTEDDAAAADTGALFVDEGEPPAELWARDEGREPQAARDEGPAAGPPPAADALPPPSQAATPAARRTPREPAPGMPPRASRSAKEPTPGMPRPALEDGATSVNIFSSTVALDDLQAALDISVPSQDLSQLENQLRARLSDKVVACLRQSQLAEGQFVLMPRIARFARGGNLVPCTVKNLAKAYTKLFGDLRDLRPYVSDRLMTGEVPEMGWSLITAEAPRESLGKDYMEQNQYLRWLATSLGIPSHLVRRRTLVEALYDTIVGRLVLEQRLQRQTLDWTASSAERNDYVCLYSADEGIRVRQLSRTTRHPALGVCPSW